MPPKGAVIKWTVQSSHTEHEQHRLRMSDIKHNPADIHRDQDSTNIPEIVRSKIVLSGLRSSEQERHWQVELARHRSSTKSIHTKVRVPDLGDPPRDNPFSLKRFKVAAEIETQNDRMMNNLRNVRPTVMTAVQCREDTEVRRRARRHFQRYPTPTGKPTIAHSAPRLLPPIDDDDNDDARENERDESNLPHYAQSARKPPRKHKKQHNGCGGGDVSPSAASSARQQQQPSYEELCDERERGWDSTTRVIHVHAKSKSLVHEGTELVSLPTPLRKRKNSPTSSSPTAAAGNQRQLLASSSVHPHNIHGVSPRDQDDDSSVSSYSDDSSGRAAAAAVADGEEGEEAATSKQTRGRGKKNSGGVCNNTSKRASPPKPRPPQHPAAARPRPNHRVSFLAALKGNPLLPKPAAADEEEEERKEEQDESTQQQQVHEDVSENQGAKEQQQQHQEEQVVADESSTSYNIKESSSSQAGAGDSSSLEQTATSADLQTSQSINASQTFKASKKTKEEEEKEAARLAEIAAKFERKFENLEEFERDERGDMHTIENDTRLNELYEKERQARRLAQLVGPCRTVQFFVRNRAPVNLVRKLVLLGVKRRADVVAKYILNGISRQHVLETAIDQTTRRGAEDKKRLENEDKARSKLCAEESKLRAVMESEEEHERTDNIAADHQQTLEEMKGFEQTMESPRQVAIARPMSRDAVEAALGTRSRELSVDPMYRGEGESDENKAAKNDTTFLTQAEPVVVAAPDDDEPSSTGATGIASGVDDAEAFPVDTESPQQQQQQQQPEKEENSQAEESSSPFSLGSP